MSYLEEREAEEEKKAAGAAVADLDLSKLEPTPAPRARADLQEKAIEEGRKRGFGRTTEAAAQVAPKPAKRSGRASGPVKRYIVSLDAKPPKGQQGQIAVSGDARAIYDFIRRAHFERKSRGELLAEMLALYIEKHGETPSSY